MKRTARRYKSAVVMLVAAAAMTACSSGSDTADGPSGAPEKGGSLVVGMTRDIQTFIPANMIDQSSYDVANQIFDPLFTTAADGETEPALAESMEFSADALTATVKLRSGVKFSNGNEVQAADVVFSLDELRKSSSLGTVYATISDVKAIDNNTVAIKLTAPQNDLPELLSIASSAIVPANYGGLTRAEFDAHPIGTGPFTLVSRDPGTKIELARNDSYWRDGKPYLDKVTYEIFKDANALSLAFNAGTVDLAQAVPLPSLRTFTDGRTVFAKPASATDTLIINPADGPLADLNVRQAISHAIDRAKIVKGLLDGDGAASETLTPPGVLPDGFEPSADAWTYDVDQARQLLADSDEKRRNIKLTYPTGQAESADVAQVIQQSLAEVGFEVTLDPLDPSALTAAVLSGKTELTLTNMNASAPTPSGFIAFYVGTAGYGGGWDVAPATKAVNDFVSAADDTARVAAIEGFESYVSDTVPAIPLYATYTPYVLSNSVGGFGVNSYKVYHVEDIWKSTK